MYGFIFTSFRPRTFRLSSKNYLVCVRKTFIVSKSERKREKICFSFGCYARTQCDHIRARQSSYIHTVEQLISIQNDFAWQWRAFRFIFSVLAQHSTWKLENNEILNICSTRWKSYLIGTSRGFFEFRFLLPFWIDRKKVDGVRRKRRTKTTRHKWWIVDDKRQNRFVFPSTREKCIFFLVEGDGEKETNYS